MEYTVIGDAVNLAAHLNRLADPGEIIISKSVYESLEDIITVEPLAPQNIKGKTEPVETFKLLSIKDKRNAKTSE
jgi:adenylate cyclase